jgi:hypothetical protein
MSQMVTNDQIMLQTLFSFQVQYSFSMAISQINQHYLQAMAIDLYAQRQAQSVVPAAMAKVAVKPMAPLISLDELKTSRFIADICCLLDIHPETVTVVAANQFCLGKLNWLFSANNAQIGIEQDQLTTPLLTQLTSVEAKRALWLCLAPWLISRLAQDSKP